MQDGDVQRERRERRKRAQETDNQEGPHLDAWRPDQGHNLHKHTQRNAAENIDR